MTGRTEDSSWKEVTQNHPYQGRFPKNATVAIPWESMSDIYGIMAMLLVTAHIVHVVIFCIRSHPSYRSWWKNCRRWLKLSEFRSRSWWPRVARTVEVVMIQIMIQFFIFWNHEWMKTPTGLNTTTTWVSRIGDYVLAYILRTNSF